MIGKLHTLNTFFRLNWRGKAWGRTLQRGPGGTQTDHHASQWGWPDHWKHHRIRNLHSTHRGGEAGRLCWGLPDHLGDVRAILHDGGPVLRRAGHHCHQVRGRTMPTFWRCTGTWLLSSSSGWRCSLSSPRRSTSSPWSLPRTSWSLSFLCAMYPIVQPNSSPVSVWVSRYL